MAYSWPDLGLINSLLRGCFPRFCGLFVARFGTDLRGLLGTVLWPVCGLFVARFGTDL